MPETPIALDDRGVLALRPPKNRVDPRRPYAFFVEPEHSTDGAVEDVATIFLTNRECPLRCVFCDLWKNTTDERVPGGAIPEQIDYALSRLPAARHVKLYNSGNFFDPRAIPPEDHEAIARRVRGFRTVIVENHPRMCGPRCVRFRERIGTGLEVAMGLETVHEGVLARLNKRMTPGDFERATRFLIGHGIGVRAFVLLRPPFMSEAEGVEWAVRSMAFAFALGVGCCSVIPTRGGNGIMERLAAEGRFAPPMLRSVERALEAGLGLGGGRVIVDLWDVERLFRCERCGPRRAARLREMNLTQRIAPQVECDCEGDG